MAVWRTLGSVVAVLAVAGAASAQTYPLTEAPLNGCYFHNQLSLSLSGDLKVNKGGKVVPLRQTATAGHDYLERVLDAPAGGPAQKAARFYKSAKAVITVGSDKSERAFGPGHALLVAQRFKDQPLVYCPNGPLTREELELTEHFDTLSVTGLLPGKAVSVNDTWKVANGVAQALCDFEGLTAQDLTCKLEQVKDGVAHVSVTGTASGIDTGALAKLTIRASYQFDLKQRRLTRLEWNQKDERDQGPASPASAVEATTTLTRTPAEAAPELSDVALVGVPDGYDVPATMLLLSYHDERSRYELAYSREWQTVGRTEDQLVLRLMERGDFVAQVTITPWKKAATSKHLSGEEFQEAMDETPGWEAEEVLQAGEVSSEGGRWTYRLSAVGQMDGLKVLQNFYLVAGPEGEQVVLAFTMTPAQAKKLGTRDLSLVQSIDFPSLHKDAEKPKAP
jgi:hypothetical protein